MERMKRRKKDPPETRPPIRVPKDRNASSSRTHRKRTFNTTAKLKIYAIASAAAVIFFIYISCSMLTSGDADGRDGGGEIMGNHSPLLSSTIITSMAEESSKETDLSPSLKSDSMIMDDSQKSDADADADAGPPHPDDSENQDQDQQGPDENRYYTPPIEDPEDRPDEDFKAGSRTVTVTVASDTPDDPNSTENVELPKFNNHQSHDQRDTPPKSKDSAADIPTDTSAKSDTSPDASDESTPGTVKDVEHQIRQFGKTTTFPSFKHVPSSDSMCHPDQDANNRTDETIAAYCENVNCMHHEKDVDDELLVSLGEDAIEEDSGGCKMLWFAALHESDKLCDTASGHHAYSVDYSVALNSALKNAHDSLQPVLLVGRFGMDNENSNEPRKFGRWAEQRGVKVIHVPRLTFQDDVIRGNPSHFQNKMFGPLQGPFLRLDIPKFVKEHSLFDMPNVCKHHVLYTDVDVIFANRITQQDVQSLSKSTGQAIVSYGREYSKHHQMFNTGVMVMNVERFEQELPKMLQQARDEEVYPQHDQQMLNNYREANDTLKEKFQLLPMHYNWKAYWRLEPSTFSQIKILHLHGPKFGIGLQAMGKCNVTAISLIPQKKAYKPHLRQGICCDRGRTAEWSVEAIHHLKAPIDDLCDIAASDSSVAGTNTTSDEVVVKGDNNREANFRTNKDAPLWVRLSSEESRDHLSRDCSAHPFKHCCLGQCRQEDAQLEKNGTLWKLNEDREESGHLAKLTDVLDYFASNIQSESNSSCNIIFAGDSLSSDHAMGAACQLLSSGYKLTSCNTKQLGGPSYGSDGNVTCESNIYPQTAHVALENDMEKSCKKVLIMYTGIDTVAGHLRLPGNTIINDVGGLIVFNWGVHCNQENDGCILSKLRSTILPMVKGENETIYKQWRFLSRETEPQHFDTIDGSYNPDEHRSQNCVPISGKVNNWRNQQVASILLNNGLSKQIQTIPLYDALVPLWQLHRQGDCTHYCYNPFRFDVTWNGMLKALSAFETDKSENQTKVTSSDAVRAIGKVNEK